jgi:hypothetical protein
MRKLFFAALLVIVLGFSTLAQGELINNGGGLIYDSDLNITWYDAPAVKSTFYDAMSWASGLKAGGVQGWRLPHILPVNGSSYNYGYSANGSTDIGHNISAPGSAYPGSTASEMAHLHYTSLGNQGLWGVNGNYQPNAAGLLNKGPFTYLVDSWYWSGTEYGPNHDVSVFYFGFVHGLQWQGAKDDNNRYALAVHDGNVGASAVPEPAGMLLLGLGLVGIVGFKRRSRN